MDKRRFHLEMLSLVDSIQHYPIEIAGLELVAHIGDAGSFSEADKADPIYGKELVAWEELERFVKKAISHFRNKRFQIELETKVKKLQRAVAEVEEKRRGDF